MIAKVGQNLRGHRGGSTKITTISPKNVTQTLLFPLNVSKFHHHASWKHRTSTWPWYWAKATDPLPTKWQIQEIWKSKKSSTVFSPLAQSSSPSRKSLHPCIWIRTCCYGNRHPVSLARLVWPELVVSFKKKKNLHIPLLFTLKCHWTLSRALAEKSFSGWAVSWG